MKVLINVQLEIRSSPYTVTVMGKFVEKNKQKRKLKVHATIIKYYLGGGNQLGLKK